MWGSVTATSDDSDPAAERQRSINIVKCMVGYSILQQMPNTTLSCVGFGAVYAQWT